MKQNMGQLDGKIAWVTGAGSGIGRAAAIALAGDGAVVILTGRQRAPLEAVAGEIGKASGRAVVEPADVSDYAAVKAIADRIRQRQGRLDILFSNAGSNVSNRRWPDMTPEGVDAVIAANLASAFNCSLAVLPMMREQQDGLLIHTSSWAGRHVSLLSGAAYSAAKHGVVAMSESINQDECVNGIRSCCLCPAEVATPILDRRPVPVSPEERARMLQPEDMAAIVLFVARQPKTVCVNEILVSPTWNRGYVAARQSPHVRKP